MNSLIKQAISHVHSRINPVRYSKSIGVSVGAGCSFFSLHPGAFGSEPYLITIGNRVTITQGVRFITHDGSVLLFRDRHPELDVFGPIVIEDNVFIGAHSVILPGVTIGSNSIIGAMSLVNKCIPANSVAVGVPAKVIGASEDHRISLLRRNARTANMAAPDKRRLLTTLPYCCDEQGRRWITSDEHRESLR